MSIDSIRLFNTYRANNYRPALLETFNATNSGAPLFVLGRNPSKVLEVKDNALWLDKNRVGNPLDIFDYLKLPDSNAFFPAWIGFFSYEFARHINLPTNKPMPEIPECCFHFYEDGYRWDSENIYEKTKEDPVATHLHSDYSPVNFEGNFSKDHFIRSVQQVQESIKNGNVYQVNLSHRNYFNKKETDPLLVYKKLRETNPSPFMGIMGDKRWSIVSASPERLFKMDNGFLSSRPIAGTRPRGDSQKEDLQNKEDLLNSAKERAEHAMLVDLLRNDIAKVSIPGTTHATETYTIEYYSHVMHLVSEIQSKTKASLKDVFCSIFPGGTITGAPKKSAMESILEHETASRGPYTGSLGYISSGFGADFNILIRSLSFTKDTGYLSNGAGIVINSCPKKEYDEIKQKAKSSKHAIHAEKRGKGIKSADVSGSWKPDCAVKVFNYSVCFVENHDSFSYNIIDYLKILGCKVVIVDHKDKPNINNFSHVILGPGPKSPATSGQLLSWVKACSKANKPTLGICLGHQAIATYFGAQIEQAKRPIHGEICEVKHAGDSIFAGLKSPLHVARYHSLIAQNTPDNLKVLARSKSNELMAFKHENKPMFGVQFHPESFLSEQGLHIFSNFLKVNNETNHS